MSKLTPEEQKQVSERLALAREQLRATGATVLSPTAEWVELQKEVRTLARMLK